MAKVSPFVLIPPIIFAALAGLFASAMYMRDAGEQQLPSALVGQAAPALPAGTLPGLPALDPAVLADGNVKLVNFFASWCAPCRIEAPQLLTLAGEGIPMYGIAYKDDPAKSVSFLDELGNPYKAAGADPDGRTAVNWGIYGVPETFVVDGEGKVVARLAEPLTEDALARRLRPALQAAAAN